MMFQGLTINNFLQTRRLRKPH